MILEKIKEILFQQKSILEKKYAIKKIGVFGSYVRGEQNKQSDLDILVEFEKPMGLFKFLDLEEYISNITNLKVDLVSKKALKPRIGKYILDEVVFIW